MHKIFEYYLVASAIVGVLWLAANFYGDYHFGESGKTGYSYKDPVTYLLLVLLVVPGVNLVTIGAILWLYLRRMCKCIN